MTGSARQRPAGAASTALVFALLAAPTLHGCLNHYLIHPRETPPGVVTWQQEVTAGSLRIHIEGARPKDEERFPAVLVHPEAGKTAKQMRGVLRDLASRGYLAVAADYERLLRGRYRPTLFAWREKKDTTAALDLLRADPRVDGTRIATLGFSQGGVFSLLIAARAPEVKAVVAYYPVTDFEAWLTRQQSDPMTRLIFGGIRWYFRRESEARNDEDFSRILGEASPYRHAAEIQAPVLLIHGDRDRSASVEESKRLAARLQELGREVELIVVADGTHVFNFKRRDLALRAWEATVRWLDTHLALPRPTDHERARVRGAQR